MNLEAKVKNAFGKTVGFANLALELCQETLNDAVEIDRAKSKLKGIKGNGVGGDMSLTRLNF